jgi:hypothetical protein
MMKRNHSEKQKKTNHQKPITKHYFLTKRGKPHLALPRSAKEAAILFTE